MATAWEVLTGNSTLPVQPGTTAWDHLLNQEGGGVGVIYGDGVIAMIDNIQIETQVELGEIEAIVTVEPRALEVSVDEAVQIEVEETIIEGEI